MELVNSPVHRVFSCRLLRRFSFSKLGKGKCLKVYHKLFTNCDDYIHMYFLLLYVLQMSLWVNFSYDDSLLDQH